MRDRLETPRRRTHPEGPVRTGVLITVLFLLASGPAFGDGSAERLIKRGDRLYGNRGKGAKWCEKSLETYEKALAISPKNVEASWKFARAALWLGGHCGDVERGKRIFKKGIELAKRAVAIDAGSVESHYWFGACLGRYGEFNGVMNSLGLLEPVKQRFHRVMELDPKYESGGAHRALGYLYFRLPSVAGGSNEKAIEFLKKAVEIDEKHLLNHLFIAEVYMAEGEDALAEKHLKLILDAEYEEGRRPENDEQKAAARKFLEKLKRD